MQIEIHPGGGRYIGSYYKTSTSDRGSVKVVGLSAGFPREDFDDSFSPDRRHNLECSNFSCRRDTNALGCTNWWMCDGTLNFKTCAIKFFAVLYPNLSKAKRKTYA
jgi:hypothetical protein